MKKTALHLGAWLAVLGFWMFVSRGNHPTLLLNFLASATLVAASAAAVYALFLGLLPRHRTDGRTGRLVIELLAIVAVLVLGAVLTIQYIYDVLWGPDPARFGFWTNVGLETAFIFLHLLAAASLRWIIRQISDRRCSDLD